MAKAIDGFFQRLVDSALNPLLDLLSRTLLTTPEPGDLPRVGELWQSSWQLVLAMYGLLVMAAGILLMVRETLQDRWSPRELVPRLVVGFLAGAMSMVIATQAIRFANALAYALAGDGVDSESAAAALRELADTGPASAIFLILLKVALEVLLLLLLIAYVIRVAITVILVVAAPLALMCHALPGLDQVARWWWRAFAACLAIQVVQSLVLVTSLRVFLTPGGWNMFGPNTDGIVNLIIGLALVGVLVKTPFWLLSTLRIDQGRSLAGSIARGYITYKTFGLLRGGEKAAAAALGRGRSRQTATAATPPRPEPDPYSRSLRATRDGQLMLPLKGVRRVKRQPPAQPEATSPPTPKPAPATARGGSGEQLVLPLPQWHTIDLGPKPRLGRDGQYRLPITVTRVPKSPQSATRPVTAPLPGTRSLPVSPPRRRGRQLALDFRTTDPDPYAKVRPLRDGQYPLPIPVGRRVQTPTPPTVGVPPPTPPPQPPTSRPSGRQLHLPLPDLPVKRRTRHRPSDPPRGGSR
ncbi:hypothetical protein [Nocardia wallacei]|uniref:hypothetical protein n=1 Tax=Nocardia wallacei TaxID=480035 RepID=UPI002457EE0C|nr:hypothetical protein [Nocardia wallacei]